MEASDSIGEDIEGDDPVIEDEELISETFIRKKHKKKRCQKSSEILVNNKVVDVFDTTFLVAKKAVEEASKEVGS